MPKRPSKKTPSRKAKQRKRAPIKRTATSTPKPDSAVMSRLISRLSSAGNLARQHLAITCTIGACIVLGLVIWSIVAWLTAPEIGSEVGNRAPDFTLQTVDGESISLKDLRGKTVILDFWQAEPSICPSSQNPLEDVSRLSRELQAALNRWPDKKNLAILAIAPLTDSAEGKDFSKKLGITFPIAFDPSKKIYTDYDIAYDPTRVFIDKRGIIRAIMPGPALSTDEIDGILQSIKKHHKINSTRPVISNILVSSITDKKAVIEFATDKPALGWLIVDGPDSLFCTKPEVTATTDHTIILDSLQPDTIYNFRILASHENNMESPYLSQKSSFTTLEDTLPPAISSVTVSDITDYSVTISWHTDEPANSQLEYGTMDSNNKMLKQDEKLTASHSISLATLDADTTYQFTIKSRDSSGNESSTDGSFTTISPSTKLEPVTIGSPAPEFTLPTLDGKAVSLSDYRGNRIMLHFWSAICRTCITEMSLIRDVYNYNKISESEIVILAISSGDSAGKVKEIVGSLGITFPVLLDSEMKAKERYQSEDIPLGYFPATFFIDSDGTIRNIVKGAFRSSEQLEEILKSF